MSDTADGPVFPTAPPERIALPDGVALVRPRADLVTSGVAAINASLDHLRPWMAWAEQPATPQSLGAVYAEGDAQWEQRTDFLYVLVDSATDEVVGGAGLHGRLGRHGLEIGYWVRADRTGHGLATSLATALTAEAFAIPGIERVRIQCEVDNVRSARVPEKLGYVLVATDVPDGGPCAGRSTRRYEIERAAWTDALEPFSG